MLVLLHGYPSAFGNIKTKLQKGLLRSISWTNLSGMNEIHQTMESAILREKAIKRWNRKWKLRVIEKMNPQWRDLYTDII